MKKKKKQSWVSIQSLPGRPPTLREREGENIAKPSLRAFLAAEHRACQKKQIHNGPRLLSNLFSAQLVLNEVIMPITILNLACSLPHSPVFFLCPQNTAAGISSLPSSAHSGRDSYEMQEHRMERRTIHRKPKLLNQSMWKLLPPP